MRRLIQKFNIWLSALILITQVCVASQATGLNEESHLLDRLIEDRVYIQTNSIYFSPTQIYIRMDENLIPIQHLSCDANGVFISLQDIQAGREMQETWICKNPDCGYENYVGIDNCGRCGRNRYAKDGFYINSNQ